MTFKSALWQPIAVVLSGLNLLGVFVFASDPVHATAHAALAVAFGLWAQRLRRAVPASERQNSFAGDERQDRLEELEGQMDILRRELSETQERLDFAERLLAQGRESRRVGPDR
jgi:hypothetical protein